MLEQRLLEFIAGLRLAGLRISVAESADAFRAVEQVGMLDRSIFREALRLAVVKRPADGLIFDELFPVYFERESPQMVDLMARLSPQERQMLYRAVQTLLAQLDSPAHQRPDWQQRPGDLPLETRLENLTQTLDRLLQGERPDAQTLSDLRQQGAGNSESLDPARRWRVEQRVLQQMQGQLMGEVRQRLPGLLRHEGLDSRQTEALLAGLDANLDTLSQQVAEHLEFEAAHEWTAEQERQTRRATDLLDRQFQALTEREVRLLRQEIRRLVARLRSQMALRRKRRRRGTLDIRRTLRQNMRYGGVPLRLYHKSRDVQPRLLLLCDISNSMRRVVEFALRLVYEVQDQVSKVRTFTYIDTIDEISPLFARLPAEAAIAEALSRLPPKYPNTDLGQSLALLLEQHPDALDRRTTVIIVGDACNSWNDPRLDLMAKLQRFSRGIIWFNPRHPGLWAANDCDMLQYVPYARAVHRVSTLKELSAAVEAIV